MPFQTLRLLFNNVITRRANMSIAEGLLVSSLLIMIMNDASNKRKRLT